MTIIHNLINTFHRCSEKRFTTMNPSNHTELNSTLFHRKCFRQTYRQERTFQKQDCFNTFACSPHQQIYYQ